MDRCSCIRCRDLPAFDEFGTCVHCHRVVAAEAERGIWVIELYLANWAAFRAWEAQDRAA